MSEGYIATVTNPQDTMLLNAISRARARVSRMPKTYPQAVFRVYILETRARGDRQQPWCPTLAAWFHPRSAAASCAKQLRPRAPGQVYRVRRYVATTEVVRG